MTELRPLQSEQINELAPALVKSQATLQHAAKDATNPHFKSSYATLESVIDATRDAYAREGLVVSQQTVDAEKGVLLVTTLMHASGQWLRSYTPVMNAKGDAQGMGSGLSYARRYALAAMANITQTDDDGNDASASKRPVTTAKPPALPQPAAKPIINNAGQARQSVLVNLSGKRGWAHSDVRAVIEEQFGKGSANDLSLDEFEAVCKLIETNDGATALTLIRAQKAAEARAQSEPISAAESEFLSAPSEPWEAVTETPKPFVKPVPKKK